MVTKNLIFFYRNLCLVNVSFYWKDNYYYLKHALRLRTLQMKSTYCPYGKMPFFFSETYLKEQLYFLIMAPRIKWLNILFFIKTNLNIINAEITFNAFYWVFLFFFLLLQIFLRCMNVFTQKIQQISLPLFINKLLIAFHLT